MSENRRKSNLGTGHWLLVTFFVWPVISIFILLLLSAFFPQIMDAAPWDTGSYYPPWRNAGYLNLIEHSYDGGKTAEQNGADLAAAIQGLTAGDKLVIEGGTYSINMWFNIEIQGTHSNPIWITAGVGETVIFTRPDDAQNVINVGSNALTEYVCFSGIEITGGASLLRLFHCSNVWVDQCYLHDGGGVGITANTYDTDSLYLTRNHIHNPGSAGDTAEGMYLGANASACRMTNSVVALNYVHDCGGDQGDGIELKQGSYDNWIAENEVHDTNYPGILVYGTDGLGYNMVEWNIVYRSNDNAMQIQGEAIVRNNLVMNASGSVFASQFHQAEPTDLTVVHNTFINSGRAVRLSSWDSKTEMIFANNACYSEISDAILVVGGETGVTFAGNVSLGVVNGAGSGFTPGNGLADFVSVDYGATLRDARPVETGALRGAADRAFKVSRDLDGIKRDKPLETGAYEIDDPDPEEEVGCGGGCAQGGFMVWPFMLAYLWVFSRKHTSKRS